MKFEWDDNKNDSNLKKHGISFNQTKEIFSDKNKIVIPDLRKDYGESRVKIIGKALDLVLSVIYYARCNNTNYFSKSSKSQRTRNV